VGWERVTLQNSGTTRRHQAKQNNNATTRQWETMGGNNERNKANKKEAQETSDDIFWAVGKFFYFSLFMFLLLTFLGIYLN
jgi:hypothetical protein